jgi:hypothetical protein
MPAKSEKFKRIPYYTNKCEAGSLYIPVERRKDLIDNYMASALLSRVIPRNIIPQVEEMINREPHLMSKPQEFSPKRIRETLPLVEFGDYFRETYDSELSLMNEDKGIIHLGDRCIEADKEVMAIIKSLTLVSFTYSEAKRLAVSSIIDQIIDICKSLPMISLKDLSPLLKKSKGDYFYDQVIEKIRGVIGNA